MGLNIKEVIDTRATVTADPRMPPRDHYDRPKVLLPDGSKRVPYTRTSSAGGVLEDMTGIIDWKLRLVALGASKFPALLEPLEGVYGVDEPEDKAVARSVSERLLEAAGASTKAESGTDFHSWTEAYDRGDSLSELPEHFKRMMDNYHQLVEKMRAEVGYEVLAAEQFGVNDVRKVAGTTDRVALVNGKACIVDVKTSGSMDFGVGKFAMQIEGYSGMRKYDDLEATKGVDEYGLGVGRAPFAEGYEVDREVGYILWVPQHGETAAFAPIDLTRAEAGYKLAEELKEWRNSWKRKANKFTPIIAV